MLLDSYHFVYLKIVHLFHLLLLTYSSHSSSVKKNFHQKIVSSFYLYFQNIVLLLLHVLQRIYQSQDYPYNQMLCKDLHHQHLHQHLDLLRYILPLQGLYCNIYHTHLLQLQKDIQLLPNSNTELFYFFFLHCNLEHIKVLVPSIYSYYFVYQILFPIIVYNH